MRVSEPYKLANRAFKPRTSPYAFQGMGSNYLDLLVAAKKATGLPICTELMAADNLDEFNEKANFIKTWSISFL